MLAFFVPCIVPPKLHHKSIIIVILVDVGTKAAEESEKNCSKCGDFE